MRATSEKIVVVTRRTRLEELIARFNTLPQAKFYITHMGLDFAEYEREHQSFTLAAKRVLGDLNNLGKKVQRIDWTFLPNFLFTPQDTVVVLGRDGLVSNTAKYLHGQPIVGVNPDPQRIDGVLLPFLAETAAKGVTKVLEHRCDCKEVTMAEVTLNDGQKLRAFNDFYIGQRTHISSRYRLQWHGESESQSSSGVIVSTGAGSTGWLSSTQNMAAAVTGLLTGERPSMNVLKMPWDDPRLVFVVREPFRSRASGIRFTAGMLAAGEELQLESLMPEGGVIFSDGVEADALAFNSGAIARIRAGEVKTRLVCS
jgi:NAD kinase